MPPAVAPTGYRRAMGRLPPDDAALDAAGLDDAALDAEALAAAPEPEVPDDAVPFDGLRGDGPHRLGGGAELLPTWYMPVPRATGRTGWRIVAVAAIVGSFVLVNAVGLCVTYGWPEIAW